MRDNKIHWDIIAAYIFLMLFFSLVLAGIELLADWIRSIL